MKIKLIFLLLVSLACASCAAQSSNTNSNSSVDIPSDVPPIWVTDIDALYPDNEYITGLGYGKTLEEADNAAKAALSSYIIQSVENNTISQGNISLNTSGMTQEYEIQKEMVLSSSISEIVGLSIKERWFDTKSTYYALAVLSKEEASDFYTDKIRKNNSAIDALLASADKAPATFEGYSSLLSAIPFAVENEEYLTILSTVDNTKKRLYDSLSQSPDALSIKAKEFAQDISIEIDIKNDINDSVTLELLNTFSSLGIQAKDFSLGSANYIFIADLNLDKLGKQGNNYFVTYSLQGKLENTLNNKSLTTIDFYGRDGHISEKQAVQRALTSINNYIKNDFVKKLSNLQTL